MVGMCYKQLAAGEVATIDTFKKKLKALKGMSLEAIVLADLNESWLRCSGRNDTVLKAACDETELKQILTQRMKEEHVLNWGSQACTAQKP